jgi:hypothetical protein
VDHQWLAGGWQFALREAWTLTPEAGIAYSSLEAEDEELFDDQPVSRIHEVIPFAELAPRMSGSIVGALQTGPREIARHAREHAHRGGTPPPSSSQRWVIMSRH